MDDEKYSLSTIDMRFTDSVLMIRPRQFGYNEETAMNNRFQKEAGKDNTTAIAREARGEFDQMVDRLRAADIQVEVVEDTAEPVKPDAVFPNNWLTTHRDGSIITYPMYSRKRRTERREDLLVMLTEKYGHDRQHSLKNFEQQEQYLEATGSMVLDRARNEVYAALGPRTHSEVLDEFCRLKGFDKIVFQARDRNGALIYHTNVMMALGNGFVVICMDSIRDKGERKNLLEHFEKAELELIEISLEQMEQFAGNMLQLLNRQGKPVLIMSSQAHHSLESDQLDKLSRYTDILHIPLKTIETYGGGSARCMLAEIFYRE